MASSISLMNIPAPIQSGINPILFEQMNQSRNNLSGSSPVVDFGSSKSVHFGVGKKHEKSESDDSIFRSNQNEEMKNEDVI